MDLRHSIADAVRSVASFDAEAVFVVTLDAMSVLGLVRLRTGDQGSVSVTPADVIRLALQLGADEVILVHTHVDDTPPSIADQAVTRRVRSACAFVGLRLVEHLVVTPGDIFVCDGTASAA